MHFLLMIVFAIYMAYLAQQWWDHRNE